MSQYLIGFDWRVFFARKGQFGISVMSLWDFWYRQVIDLEIENCVFMIWARLYFSAVQDFRTWKCSCTLREKAHFDPTEY